MSSAREESDDEETGAESDSPSAPDKEYEDEIVESLIAKFGNEIAESGRAPLGDEFVDRVASSLVEKMSSEFPEITIKSKQLDDVLDDFREKKLEEVDSHDHYNRKIDYIEQYLISEINADTTDGLTSQDVERYEKWRKYDSLDRDKPLADNTLRDDLYLFREFIQYMAKHRMVPVRFKDLIEIPKVDYKSGDGVDEKKLDPEFAKTALEYLRKYRYAGVEHVTMELLCHSGPRNGGLHGRDVDDFDYDESVLDFEHSEDTKLKKDKGSERAVTLFGDLPDIIQDYLDHQRPDVTDENGREPLLTKGNGRISTSTIRKIAYKWTRPCAVGLGCPHDRDPDECEAAQINNRAYKCPSSRAPHHIRKGYITDQRTRGVSPGGIDQRCDVTPRVQKLHYDLPEDDEDRRRYDEEFRNADDDPNSGYNH